MRLNYKQQPDMALFPIHQIHDSHNIFLWDGHQTMKFENEKMEKRKYLENTYRREGNFNGSLQGIKNGPRNHTCP